MGITTYSISRILGKAKTLLVLAHFYLGARSLQPPPLPPPPPSPSSSSSSPPPVYFIPGKLRNLILTDEIESLNPLLDLKVGNLCNEATPQLYAACGRGARSSLRVIRQGRKVCG